MTPVPTPHDEDPKNKRRAQIREAAGRHYERIREMTKLEQAALKERKLLGEEKSPYTEREAAEMIEIRKQMFRLQARAETLNRTILHRLGQEASRDEGKAALLARFEKMRGYRVDLPAF
ncbi:hypothetical protein GIY56_13205 [Paracoccus sp. YIM 132242]|uniref:Uncharacterized protein n=1 Tax=Paracoccus lichenicola TaxID=2665644 RepID=A0A6L6HSJ5_9RHOB|nr:hypothetical protein [Paracoccus lichenicola]MTE01241.1 hypothetical protein [Paracoccus lichenicola]